MSPSRKLMWALMWCAAGAAICFAVLAHKGQILHGLMWIACGVCAVFSVTCGLLFATIKIPNKEAQDAKRKS